MIHINSLEIRSIYFYTSNFYNKSKKEVNFMKKIMIEKKVLISFFILIVFMFLGSMDRIKWIYYNINILKSSQIPEDININAVESIVDAKNGYDIFLNGIGLGNVPFIIIIAPLLVGYLFSERFAYFLATGFGNMCIVRENFKRYFLNDIKLVLFKTFNLILFSESTFLLLCVIFFSANNPIEGYSNINGIFKMIYYEHPLIYCMLQIVNQSLFITILGIFGYSLTAFIQNRIIISLSPFIIYMITTILCQISDSTIGYNLCRIVYPDFILFPFLYENNVVQILSGYLVYFFIIIVLLKVMYKKFDKNYIR